MFFRRRGPNRQKKISTKKKKPSVKKPAKRKVVGEIDKALGINALDGEYFQHATPEESDEVARILAAENHFDVLELDHKDDLDEQEDILRRSYLDRVLLLNPGVSNHPRMEEAFKKLSEAYDVLSDPQLRRKHRIQHYGRDPQETTGDIFQDLMEALFQPPQAQRGGVQVIQGGPPMIFGPPRMFGPQSLAGHPLLGGPRRAPFQVRRQPQQDPMLGMMEALANSFMQPRRRLRAPPTVVVQRREGGEAAGMDDIDAFFTDMFRFMEQIERDDEGPGLAE